MSSAMSRQDTQTITDDDRSKKCVVVVPRSGQISDSNRKRTLGVADSFSKLIQHTVCRPETRHERSGSRGYNRNLVFDNRQLKVRRSGNRHIRIHEVHKSPHCGLPTLRPRKLIDPSLIRQNVSLLFRKMTSEYWPAPCWHNRYLFRVVESQNQGALSRARHNPHKIGVGATDIPHPPSPTGPFIFPTFSGIGPAIFPTC
jgi:hypothetical protein